MEFINPITCPAYYLEQTAFNPREQPEHRVHREVLARIAAVTAPIFFLYQTVLHGICAIVDSLLYTVGITPGYFGLISSTILSAKYLYYSTLEVPQKLFFGPNKVPNYLEDPSRYEMIVDQSWASAK